MIPARETVAGEAFTNVSTSNIILTLSVMGIRSPLASVRILLSSSTVFKSSIQIASTGPSAIIHVLKLLLRLLYLAQIAAKTPVVHSPLIGSVSPYISCARIALGLKRMSLYWIPSLSCNVSLRHLKIQDFPPPEGPTSMIPCLTFVVSYNCFTFKIQSSWWTRPYFSTTVLSMASSLGYSPLGGGLIPGNKSANNDKKSGTSWATSLERFISRTVR